MRLRGSNSDFQNLNWIEVVGRRGAKGSYEEERNGNRDDWLTGLAGNTFNLLNKLMVEINLFVSNGENSVNVLYMLKLRMYRRVSLYLIVQ